MSLGLAPPPAGKHLDELCLVGLHEFGLAMGQAFNEAVKQDLAQHPPAEVHTCQALGKCYCEALLPCWVCAAQAAGASCQACDAAAAR